VNTENYLRPDILTDQLCRPSFLKLCRETINQHIQNLVSKRISNTLSSTESHEALRCV